MSDRPNISFNGFSVAWEQHKLGDVLKERSERASGNEELLSVTINNGVIRQVDSDKRNTASEDKSNYKIVRKGDLPYNSMRMWQGAVGNSKYDGIVSPAYTVLVPTDEANGKFFMELFKKESTLEIFKRWSQGLTSDTWNLKYPALSTIQFYLPSRNEQDKIAACFEKLENLIALYQRKYDEMNTLKKDMLQKMFPKKGKSTPEIRFEGFKEEWKRKKLGELYKERNEKGDESLDFLLVSIHTGVTSGEIDGENTGRNVKRSEDKSTYKHVYEGDLVFNMMRAWQGAIGVAKSEGMVSPAYISAIPNDEVYPLFMDYALRRDSVISDINNMSYGITDFRKRLYWDSFVNVECLIPSVEEQKKIYDFFNKIDMSVSLHQKRYTELTAIKKYMLQNMFV